MKLAMMILLTVVWSARSLEHTSPPGSTHRATIAVGTGPSLYDLDVTMVDAEGHTIPFGSHRGHITLVSMFYGSCTAACPMLVETIRRTVSQLPAPVRDDVRVLLVSFDAKRDTPARLREIASQRGLTSHWTLASASDDGARVIAAVLGIRYRVVAGGEYFHTAAIIALDGVGRTLGRLDGFGDPTALVDAIAPP
jgi:protein SCO1/2